MNWVWVWVRIRVKESFGIKEHRPQSCLEIDSNRIASMANYYKASLDVRIQPKTPLDVDFCASWHPQFSSTHSPKHVDLVNGWILPLTPNRKIFRQRLSATSSTVSTKTYIWLSTLLCSNPNARSDLRLSPSSARCKSTSRDPDHRPHFPTQISRCPYRPASA